LILLVIAQDFNIRVGAEFFVATLASNGGDVFSTIGEYNGWKPGMTYVGDKRFRNCLSDIALD